MKINKKAMREAIFDTALGLPINWFFAYITIVVLMLFGINSALMISIAQVVVLTILALIRKYLVRIYFKQGEDYEDTKSRN
jgi:ABC-type bacteriocin/lantibiotic exporter with double-glycine peptidase domain|tara:strand:+ start:259 stop:501 length:243 start_codon:yes stop_codon:yes gene_type:complete